jgi:hypothetical protein
MSFEALHIVDGYVYDTFEAACYARGIISNNSKWEDCFKEAKDLRTGWHLRRLLVSAVLYGGLSDAAAIWHQFRDDLCDDLAYRFRQGYLTCAIPMDRPDLDYGLYLIVHHRVRVPSVEISNQGGDRNQARSGLNPCLD